MNDAPVVMQPTLKIARISQPEWRAHNSSYLSLPSIHSGMADHREGQQPCDSVEEDQADDYGTMNSSCPFEEDPVECGATQKARPTSSADDHAEYAATTCSGEQFQETFDDSDRAVKTRFADIIGHAAAKLRIEEILLPSALPPHLADSILTGVRSLPASILLHGPPGCGKTQLAQAIAGESQASFMAISPSDILSKFVGESEASMRDVFDRAFERAGEVESKCTVLFFDEIDALGQTRGSADGGSSNAQHGGGDGCSRRVLAELLIQLNRITASGGWREAPVRKNSNATPQPTGDLYNNFAASKAVQRAESPSSSLDATDPRPRVIVVGATNRPEDCDQALLRRFGIRVYVDLPAKRDRKRIVGRLLRDVEHTLTTEQLDDLAIATEGWSGSDLEYLTREAAMAPIRACIQAASAVKRRALKLQQRGGDESSQERGSRGVDPNDLAREKLLTDFQALRPISLEDFENAVQFFLGKENEPNQRVGTLTQKRHREHYDSSSDEDS